MTDCNLDSLTFSSLGRKNVVADFRGGALTSDAGLLLLREADRQLGLTDALNDCIPDPRHPFFICHQQRHMLAQRIYAIAQGYEDLNDHAGLRVDPLMQAATERGVDPELPVATGKIWESRLYFVLCTIYFDDEIRIHPDPGVHGQG